MNLACPTLSNTPPRAPAAFDSSLDFFWDAHINDGSSSTWLAVFDDAGKVVSGAHWLFYPDGSAWVKGIPVVDTTWHPEGEGREFANCVFKLQSDVSGQRETDGEALCTTRSDVYISERAE
ncbi:hypothetical protein GLAREA_07371 [Glarea lozoyensis ATCC 20868]|uniref:Uncharacterized protein n=1 Tax=Glarea lozoyensis (strain ATCC 20868 / MF5171) TaxID=1116229 RepID=S3E156_GLAL2|nr:uncharacterized protein GLAREA_07371 [Glarea lozoyensis ATCC 20868]EPE32238.1 hypothetical protein GLAREA_07371 [Glarea lozoyensis ATCC 20868]